MNRAENRGKFWITLLMGLNVAGAGSCVVLPSTRCAAPNGEASIDVAGVYRYSSPTFQLAGTITLEQEGEVVRVVNTTYDFEDDRALMGEARLQGNLLDITLVPINGDTDYRANVRFTFSLDGDRFCVEFSDTNGDSGEQGSYTGVRVGP